MSFRPVALSLLALLSLVALSPVQAQVVASPSLMNFQGRLARPDGTPVADGTYSIRFSLHDALAGGTEKWNQTINPVTVHNGTFAVLLNTNTANLFSGNLWLEIKIGTDAPLTPRQQLVSVAFAMKANTVPDDTITAAKLLSDSGSLVKVSGGAMSSTGSNIGIGVASPSARLHLNGAMKIDSSNTLEFGAGVAGKESNAGKIGYQRFTADALDIVGAGTNATNRKIKFFAEGGATFGPISVTAFQMSSGAGANKVLTSDASGNATWQNAAGGGPAGGDLTGTYPNPTLATLASSLAKVSGGVMSSDGNKVGVNANRVLEFGLGVAGKDPHAGKIGYQTFTAGALDIVGAGTAANNRKIKFWNEGGATFAGEVIAPVVTVLGGSDVAEPYNVAPAGDIKAIPGMVVAIDPDKVGQMRVVSKAYDKTVAGIISGANGINPGITLRQKGTIADGELPVASIGRVWCYCDADANGAIEAGDMLTTSDTPGHAMKVSDHNRANGAVIGKAMSSLKSGKGLVLVLVSLK